MGHPETDRRFKRIDRLTKWLEDCETPEGPPPTGEILEAVPQAAAITSGGRIIGANDEFLELVGADGYSDLLGRDPITLVAPKERSRVQMILDRGLQGTYETILRRLDGAHVAVTVMAKQVRMNGGTVIRVATVRPRDE